MGDPKDLERVRKYGRPPPLPLEQLKRPGEEVWHRLKGESSVAYEAFREYRDLGRGRTARKAAAKVGKSIHMMHTWSRRWHWGIRSDRFDAHEEQELMVANQEARAKSREKDAQDARLIKDDIIAEIKGRDLSTFSPSQLREWYETCDRIERLSRGDVTSHVQQTIAHQKDEIQEAIRKNPDLMDQLSDLLDD